MNPRRLLTLLAAVLITVGQTLVVANATAASAQADSSVAALTAPAAGVLYS